MCALIHVAGAASRRGRNKEQMEEKLNFANVSKFTKSLCHNPKPAFSTLASSGLVVPPAYFEDGEIRGWSKLRLMFLFVFVGAVTQLTFLISEYQRVTPQVSLVTQT